MEQLTVVCVVRVRAVISCLMYVILVNTEQNK